MSISEASSCQRLAEGFSPYNHQRNHYPVATILQRGRIIFLQWFSVSSRMKECKMFKAKKKGKILRERNPLNPTAKCGGSKRAGSYYPSERIILVRERHLPPHIFMPDHRGSPMAPKPKETCTWVLAGCDQLFDRRSACPTHMETSGACAMFVANMWEVGVFSGPLDGSCGFRICRSGVFEIGIRAALFL